MIVNPKHLSLEKEFINSKCKNKKNHNNSHLNSYFILNRKKSIKSNCFWQIKKNNQNSSQFLQHPKHQQRKSCRQHNNNKS
jgi:lipopolysaccharide biosynthesis protein